MNRGVLFIILFKKIMKVIENINFYKSIGKKNRILLIFVILYSFIIFFSSFVIYDWIMKTNSSIILPNGYYSRYFGIDNPSINFSFGMENKGLVMIQNLNLEVKLDMEYFNITLEKYQKHNFFLEVLFFGSIESLEVVNHTFIGEREYFKSKILANFWQSYALSEIVDISFFITFIFKFNYLFNTIPVQISFIELDLFEFEFSSI